jgi:hypothetical protein
VFDEITPGVICSNFPFGKITPGVIRSNFPFCEITPGVIYSNFVFREITLTLSLSPPHGQAFMLYIMGEWQCGKSSGCCCDG